MPLLLPLLQSKADVDIPSSANAAMDCLPYLMPPLLQTPPLVVVFPPSACITAAAVLLPLLSLLLLLLLLLLLPSKTDVDMPSSANAAIDCLLYLTSSPPPPLPLALLLPLLRLLG